MAVLLITVRFIHGRYNAVGDWPPSPARLFQALVAAAARGAAIETEDRAALTWLETLPPPVIACPPQRAGQPFTTFVPSNDLDAVGGDPDRVPDLRVGKSTRPRLFDERTPVLYLWRNVGDLNQARALSRIAERLFQLGRGLDMAHAVAELIEEADAERLLASHRGPIRFPAVAAGNGDLVPCPARGSLASLEARFAGMRSRIARQVSGRRAMELFTQPPRARFTQVRYACPPGYLLFELRRNGDKAMFAPQPTVSAAALVEAVRDEAARRLSEAIPQQAALFERVLIGRGASEADKDQRLRIVPLPSIGHRHARGVRRVLIEIPPDCTLPREDIAWAFGGLEPRDRVTGELAGWSLAPAEDRRMLGHYGIPPERKPSRIWRTVTAAVLPEHAGRWPIASGPMRETPRARERAGQEARAVAAVLRALHHARIRAAVEHVRVQREPFAANGDRAEAFAAGTRFHKGRLWHVEIAFREPLSGLLIIGDGRYLGLGLMAPADTMRRDVLVAPILAPRVTAADARTLIHATRRALMSLSRDKSGQVPKLFSGHEADGSPAGSGRHEHIFLASTTRGGFVDRLIVAAPWACDRRSTKPTRRCAEEFDRVVSSLREVRAGKLGVVSLMPARAPSPGDALTGPARVWHSLTPYRPTRHPSRSADPRAAIAGDVREECARRGIPAPEVEVLAVSAGPRGGHPSAELRLRFAVAQHGPIMLGRDSHAGGGLFAAVDEPA